jgi:hypothetical protein
MFKKNSSGGYQGSFISYLLSTLVLLIFTQSSQAAVNETAICFDNPNGLNNPTIHLWIQILSMLSPVLIGPVCP